MQSAIELTKKARSLPSYDCVTTNPCAAMSKFFVSLVVNFCSFRGNVLVRLGPRNLSSQYSAHECDESAGGIMEASGSEDDHIQAGCSPEAKSRQTVRRDG